MQQNYTACCKNGTLKAQKNINNKKDEAELIKFTLSASLAVSRCAAGV